MRYLRKFNENVEETTYEDLKDFCETHLAYLLDDDRFELDVEDAADHVWGENVGEFYIEFLCFTRTPDLPIHEFFRWEEIKDQFITFLIHLKNKYGNKVRSLHIKTKENGYKTIVIEDLIDEERFERLGIEDFWSRINIEVLK